MPGTLVMSAWDPEIAPLRALAGAGARSWRAAAVGVGPVDAGIGAVRAMARHRPERVIFVGTAGSYPGAPVGIGEAAVAGPMVAVSTAVLRRQAYIPEPQIMRASASPALSEALRGGTRGRNRPPRVAVACPVAITRSALLARQIAGATGAALENLEAFAVARAAAGAGVPFAAVLGVSNRVGPAGHREWRVNHVAASQAACALVNNYLVRRR
jgi:futalosine hydrolase